MKYKNILIKISGEALAGEKSSSNGIDEKLLGNFCKDLINIQKKKIGISIVIGGGNIFRGLKGTKVGFDRIYGDYMGMLATAINALAFKSFLESLNSKVEIFSSFKIGSFIKEYEIKEARKLLKENYIIILAGGLGHPFFTTDTTAALRAIELSADILIKATKVDGVYDKDPMLFNDAKKYDYLDYQTAINKKLQVMDLTAISLCMENNLPICVLNIFKKDCLINFLSGKKIGSIIGGD
ncbi:MAG TPA: UMP kinase [bacterium]|nr:UMP kinase [bacterium]HOL46888.1 UMP kinase [bacterium]HPQ18763.1 UMP kinase [bacterium]